LKIDQSFKNAIKDTFYDKEISLYSVEESQDSDGGTSLILTEEEASTFLGNINRTPFKLEQAQEQYGIEEPIAALITTDADIPDLSIIGFDNLKFQVIVIKFDSHNLLLASKWNE
jgi:hypothetical protein